MGSKLLSAAAAQNLLIFPFFVLYVYNMRAVLHSLFLPHLSRSRQSAACHSFIHAILLLCLLLEISLKDEPLMRKKLLLVSLITLYSLSWSLELNFDLLQSNGRFASHICKTDVFIDFLKDFSFWVFFLFVFQESWVLLGFFFPFKVFTFPISFQHFLHFSRQNWGGCVFIPRTFHSFFQHFLTQFGHFSSQIPDSSTSWTHWSNFFWHFSRESPLLARTISSTHPRSRKWELPFFSKFATIFTQFHDFPPFSGNRTSKRHSHPRNLTQKRHFSYTKFG